MNGFILIDKPAGPTSNDVLNILKKKTGIKKMGHSGTLDPFATGLLIVAVGRATKLISFLNDEPKVYQATLKLGEATDTLDCEGKIVDTKPVQNLTAERVEQILKTFLGRQTQIPPMYSAKKMEGQKLYELAREGKSIERTPHEIEIFDIDYLGGDAPTISFRVICSRGTYVRVLGADIARKLGTVGYLTELRREKAGSFNVDFAVAPTDVVLERDLIPIPQALKEISQLSFSNDEVRSLMRGQFIPADQKIPEGLVGLNSQGSFFGVGRCDQGQIKPVRLLSEKEVYF